MSKVCYVPKNFRADAISRIDYMNKIISDYQCQGYKLTSRQLYYQLVARDVIENTLNSYKRTAALINDAKLAGLIDWDAIEDRTRDFIVRSRWENPSQILNGSARQYHQWVWHDQDFLIYVIVEKEALVGVLERTCREFDVPLLAARGYPSSSVLYDFFVNHVSGKNYQKHLILHLGDHDPSGIDMSRDLRERLKLFTGHDYQLEIKRIALNYDQIQELRPPKNPAKETDSRFDTYRKQFGTSSWELDALSPDYLNKLLKDNFWEYIDDDKWVASWQTIDDIKGRLLDVARNFGEN